jgi:hypothetical protein
VVATVDAVATTNPALYSGAGCTLATAPAILSGNWGEGYYTSCAVYDGQSGLPTKQTNAFGQSSTTSYDATQGQVPVSTKDVNGQTTTLAYTYPGGNPLVQSKLPGESGNFTNQSQTVSTCTDNSLVLCLQEDRSTSLYSSAVTRPSTTQWVEPPKSWPLPPTRRTPSSVSPSTTTRPIPSL